MKIFGRQPSVDEFRVIFKIDPMAAIYIKPWSQEMILDDCLDGLNGLPASSVKTIITTMIKNRATADGIQKYIDDIVASEGQSAWSKKAKKHFDKITAQDELIDAIATFHEDGLVAGGLSLQAEYDDYVHRVAQKSLNGADVL